MSEFGWNNDFLKREVEESNTSDKIKQDTKRALDESKRILETAPAQQDKVLLQKEYEDVRLATIASLRLLQAQTEENLDQFRHELSEGENSQTLSDGEITEMEYARIEKELDELRHLPRTAYSIPARSPNDLSGLLSNGSRLLPQSPINMSVRPELLAQQPRMSRVEEKPDPFEFGKMVQALNEELENMTLDEILNNKIVRRKIINMPNGEMCPVLTYKVPEGEWPLDLPLLKAKILDAEKSETFSNEAKVRESFMHLLSEAGIENAEKNGNELFDELQKELFPEDPYASCAIEMIKLIQNFARDRWAELSEENILVALDGALEYKKEVTFNERQAILQTYPWVNIEQAFTYETHWEIEKFLLDIGVSQYESDSLASEILKIRQNEITANRQSEVLRKFDSLSPESLAFILWSNASPEKIRTIVHLLSPMDLSEIIKDLKNRVYRIQHKWDLLHIFSEYKDQLWDISFADINPKLRWDAGVLRAFPRELKITDITDFPTTLFTGFTGKSTIEYLISIGVKKWNSEGKHFIDRVLRRAYMAYSGEPAEVMSVIRKFLASDKYTDFEKNFVKNNIPNSILLFDTQNSFWIEKKEEQMSIISEEAFNNYHQMLKDGIRPEIIQDVIGDIDRYIEQRTISAHTETVALIIEKWLFDKTSYIKDFIWDYTPWEEDTQENNPIIALQKQVLTRDLRDIAYFSSLVRGDSDIIIHAVNATSSLAEMQQIIPYLEFTRFWAIQALYNTMEEKYGAETAQIYIGSDKRFPEIAQNIMKLGVTEKSKQFLYDILIHAEGITAKFQESKGAMLESIEQSNDHVILWRISEICKSIGSSVSSDAMHELKDIFVYKETNTPEDYQRLLEIFWSQEKVQDFLNGIIDLRKSLIAEKLEIARNQTEGMIYSRDFEDDFILLNETWEKSLKIEALRKHFNDYMVMMPREKGETIEAYQTRFIRAFIVRYNLENEDTINAINGTFTLIFKEAKWEEVDGKTLADAMRDGRMDELWTRNFDTRQKRLIQEYEEEQAATNSIDEDTHTETSFDTQEKQILYKAGFDADEIESITPEEIKILRNSPEALRGMISFKETLAQLNLEEFFGYRHYIFPAIQSKSMNSGLNLQDGDYLSPKEIAIVLFTIADSISHRLTETEQARVESLRWSKQDIEKVTQLLKEINKQDSLMTAQEDRSILRDEWRIGGFFREEFLGKEGDSSAQKTGWFDTGKFLESIQ